MNLVPSSREAELAVIGSVLLQPACFREIDLSADDFYFGDTKIVWEAMQAISAEHQQIDYLSVAERPNVTSGILIEATNATPSSMNINTYVSIVKDKARRRNYIQLSSEIATTSFDENKDLQEAIPGFITRMVKASAPDKESEHVSVSLSELYDDIQDRVADPKDIYGLRTGIQGLDRITGGLQKGEVLLLSGEPGLGKSLLAMQIAFSMAKFDNAGVIYEMEMSKAQTLRRILSSESGIQVSAMKSGRVADHEQSKIGDAIGKLEKLPIFISDSTTWTTASMRSDLVKRKTLNNIQWFVVDYLRLLKDRYGKDDHERLAFIGTALHDIAKDLGIAGLVIHSMNKQGMAGSAGMATLSGSGQISYDMDSVAILTKDSKQPSVVNMMFDKLREGDGSSRTLKLAKRDGFPQFAEVFDKPYV